MKDDKLSKLPVERLVLMYQEINNKKLKEILFKQIKERFTKTIRLRTKYFYSRFGIENEETVSIILFTLFRAIETFDKERGVKFSTYFLTCINNYMSNYVRKNNDFNQNYVKTICFDDIKSEEILSIPDNKSVNNEFIISVQNGFKLLTEREKKIFNSYVYNDEGFYDISKTLGITRQRANQIFLKVVEKLKKEIF